MDTVIFVLSAQPNCGKAYKKHFLAVLRLFISTFQTLIQLIPRTQFK